MASLEKLLAERPEDILLPNQKIQEAALKGIKEVLDPVAAEYSVLDAVHVDGLDVDQIWVQAQMVVDGAIDKLFGRLSELSGPADDDSDSSGAEDVEEALSGEEFSELGSGEDQAEDEELDDEDEEEDQSIDGELVDDFDEEDFVEEASAQEESESESDAEPKTDIEKLNSGLFQLEEFQQQVLALENEKDDGSDDEIDYFGELPEDESESEEEVRYNDFFAPPKKKNKRPAAAKARRDQAEEDEDEQVDAAMETARMDLFASEDDEEEEESGATNGEKLSTFEKQQQELERQIAEYEDENVNKKEWALRGEITAGQRPQDSLVHSEIDFDRNAKPAPVITAEVTESLEDLIRDRIKKQQFDGLARRLPTSELNHKKSRELAEVQETKSQKSLAELYEEDHLRKENPDYFAKQDTQVMDAAHKEIVDLFSTLSRKLDSLSSWNYTPKAPKPSLTIVSDAAAISMEEAQPSTMAQESMLAPQEVYKASASSKEEVVGANALPVARSELTPDERRRLRRRAKAKASKSKSKTEEATNGKPVENKKDKNSMFETLKKGNVTMVDKRGQKRDMRGNVVKEKKQLTASHIKL